MIPKDINIKKDCIFVSIASYRDIVCNQTLKTMFQMASKPENIYAGICQQNRPEDEDCVVNFDTKYKQYLNNVRIIRIPEFEAKGPTFARHLCSTLWNGEEFFFQIDSHSKFVKHWDLKLIKMFRDLKNKGVKKPLISHYPPGSDEYTEDGSPAVPRMCKSFFNDRGMISFLGAEHTTTNGIAHETPYVAAGMMFSEYTLLQDVPFDPSLPYLFVGEEILHSIRIYTSGYNIYTPTENIVYHEYTRAGKDKIWTDNPYYSDVPAFEKTKMYIKLNENKDFNLPHELKNNMEKYGLGIVRTLEDYYNFAGIDVLAKTISKNFCRPNNVETGNVKEHCNEPFANYEEENKENKKRKCKKNYYTIAIYVVLLLLLLLLLWVIMSKKSKKFKLPRYFK